MSDAEVKEQMINVNMEDDLPELKINILPRGGGDQIKPTSSSNITPSPSRNEKEDEIRIESPKVLNDLAELKSTISETEFNNLRYKIIREVVNPTYYREVQSTLSARKKWRSWGNKIEAMSKILAGSATIVAFASGVYPEQYLSFIAGSLGTAAMVFQQFAIYSLKESKERTEQANKILKFLKIQEIEDLNLEA